MKQALGCGSRRWSRGLKSVLATLVLGSAGIGCGDGADMGTVAHREAVTTLSDGDWHDPLIWEGGSVPGSGPVLIRAEDSIRLDGGTTGALSKVTVDGELIFEPEQSVTLTTTGNIIVHDGGRIEMRPASADVKHEIAFEGVIEEDFVGAPLSGSGSMAPCKDDPSGEPCDTDVGLWILGSGELDAVGSSKTSWTRLLGSVDAGDTTFRVENHDGWRDRDEVVIVPTIAPTDEAGDEYWTGYDRGFLTINPDGTLSIGALNPDGTLRIDPLQHDHPRVNDQWGAEVLNLTRNVVVHGTVQGRAHVAFHHFETPQTLRFVEVHQMGPHKFGQPILGRYGLHLHMGHDHARGSLLEGLSLHDLGFRAYVPHASHGVTIQDSIAHDIVDEAFWWDEGAANDSHDAVWTRNVASKLGNNPNHNQGAFFLGNGKGNSVTECVAVGVKGDDRSAGFQWPDHAIQSAWTFNHNVSHNNEAGGLFTWQNGDKVHVVEDSVAYHNRFGLLHGAYGNRYIYRNITLYGNRIGCDLHSGSTPSNVNAQTLDNFVIDGAGIGKWGFVVSEHSTGPHAATLLRNAIIKNLCPPTECPGMGVAMNFKWTGPVNGTAREWLFLENNDFGDILPERMFHFGSSVWPESEILVAEPGGARYSLHPASYDGLNTETFTQSFTESWAGRWVGQNANPNVTDTKCTLSVASGKGRVTAPSSGSGSTLVYDVYQQAVDVDQTVNLHLVNAGSRAGLIARRSDTDRETYYKVEVGIDSANELKVYKVVDGSATSLGQASVFVPLATDTPLRFRVETDSAGTAILQAKLGMGSPTWDVDIEDAEPRLARRAGRFGVVASPVTGSVALFDDHSSTVLDPLILNNAWEARVQWFAAEGTPRVDAGPNKSTGLQDTVALKATVTDGGETNPASLSYAWSKISGDGDVVFSAPGAAWTNASFATAGIYTLRLAASNGSLTGSDDVRVVVSPTQATGDVTFNWSGSGAWPAPWFAGPTTQAPIVDISSNQGRIKTPGSTIQLMGDRNAENVDLQAKIRLSANGIVGGLVARYHESDPDTWLGARMGTSGNAPDNLEIYMVVDGQVSTLAYKASPFNELFDEGDPFKMRFSVVTNSDGTMDLKVWVWDPSLDPPDAPLLEVKNWSNAIFQGRAGRFGVTTASSLSRTVYFSELNVAFPIQEPITFEEHWAGVTGDPWPAVWVSEGTPVSVTTQANEGRIYFSPAGGSVRQYVADHVARDIDILTQVRFNASNAAAGVFALRTSPDNYVGVRFGTSTLENDKLRLFQMVDGTRTDAAVLPSPVDANIDYWLNFVVTTEPALVLRAKIWDVASDPSGLNPPAAWSIESPPGWSSAMVIEAGHFGILGGPAQLGRKLYFDDFKATFAEP
jgi:hypothetical protein